VKIRVTPRQQNRSYASYLTGAIDVDAVVPKALASMRTGSIIMGLSLLESGNKDALRGLTAQAQRWAPVVKDFVGNGSTQTQSIVDQLERSRLWAAMVTWFATLTAEQFFGSMLPSANDLHSAADSPIEKDHIAEARWLLDRFTQTYLNKWATDSLQREWRFLHSLRPGCCPSHIMRENLTNADEVARVIADRSCSSREQNAAFPSGLRPHHFMHLAVDRLNSGRRGEAVAIYRSLAELRPDDADVRNNLGFCLIPDSPAEAIDELTSAISHNNGETSAMTHLNLALAHHRNSDDEAAQAAINRALTLRGLDYSAFMWSCSEPLTVTNVTRLDDYADALIDHIAVCQGCAS